MIEQLLVRPLDVLRARLLSQSLRFEPVRWVFVSRFQRSLVFVSVSFGLNLYLMFYYPLWTLFLVPTLLGIPHWVESLSSFHQTAAPSELRGNLEVQRQVSKVLWMTCVAFVLARFGIDGVSVVTQSLHTLGARALDFAIVLISVLAVMRLYQLPTRKRLKVFLVLNVFGGLVIFAFPLTLWGVLILGHNFMAFVFWYLHAPTSSEKKLSLVFLALFAGVHFLVLSGGPNGIVNSMIFSLAVDQRPTSEYGYSFYQIGMDLFAGNRDLGLSRKIVMLLCFGQGLHYLLWIKVIPECRHQQDKPASFRMSLQLWRREWGKGFASVAVVLVLGFFIAGLGLPRNGVNDLFFGLAFFHIYAELIAVLLRRV